MLGATYILKTPNVCAASGSDAETQLSNPTYGAGIQDDGTYAQGKLPQPTTTITTTSTTYYYYYYYYY